MYSLVMDSIVFCFLIGMAVSEGLDMRFGDVVTANLYGKLDTYIYMNICEGFKVKQNLVTCTQLSCVEGGE